ncbi:mRNA splicing factor [Pyrrhoderma noxium]|uniref:mRNA splicing factor n=1 Tax=Pyrrhoderma noxium TaxID=2282107 RepID=A0A286UVF8_9AGAM|nr:mRNA splicing factor [Pyrrhoderma noxium]
MSSLAEEASARKARLLALRKKKEGIDSEADGLPVSGRNFDPQTRTLKKRNQGDEDGAQDSVEKDISGLAEQIIAEDEQARAQELDLTNIAPKRPNWDLKREMERKVAKLERKTQEAIHTLIRQRLAAQKGDSDDIFYCIYINEYVVNSTSGLSFGLRTISLLSVG